MGAVYRAEDVRLGRQVAIKVLPADAGLEGEARRRMLEEARAVARLDHPGICTLYEFDEADGQPFIVMQLVEGGSLRQALAAGPLDEDRVRAIVAALGAALSAAHARNIVHRDVKAENILFAADGAILLADFGLALLEQDTRLTRAGMMVGTPHVMAPEQITANTATPASDQFSLGVVVYECLTGVRPFRGDALPAVIHAVLNETPAPPSQIRPQLSPRWDGIVMRALAKDAGARFPSIAAFAEAAAATGTAAEAPAPPGPPGSLAVLYFDNLSSDPESDYFCAGITEDLLTDLSKVPGLSVASRNAVVRWRGAPVEIPRIAAELGVAAVLEGSVRKAGDRVRINAQLIDASSGMHLWAERYDRTLDDVFAVQDDITASIAAALRATLGVPRAAPARPGNVKAYDEYLRGRDLYVRYEEEDMHRAITHFEAAVRIDPDYALAWAGIADACGQMIDKAWDLDPAWSVRGEAAARRAVELAPGIPETHKALALALSVQGRREESNAHLLEALKADPAFVPALGNLGSARIMHGDIAGGERCLRRALRHDPNFAYLVALLSFICLATGRRAEAMSLSHATQRWGSGRLMQWSGHYVRWLSHLLEHRWQSAGNEVDALARDGFPEELSSIARLCIDAARGAPPGALPPIPAEHVLYFTTDLHFWAGLLYGDAAHVTAALRRAEAIDPYSWTSLPVWVRANLQMTGQVRHAPEMREWLGGRGRSIVWPAEAPPLADEIRADFDEVRVETGIPPADGMP